jgi:hypothetical protein
LKNAVWWRKCLKMTDEEEDEEMHTVTYDSGDEEQRSDDV